MEAVFNKLVPWMPITGLVEAVTGTHEPPFSVLSDPDLNELWRLTHYEESNAPTARPLKHYAA